MKGWYCYQKDFVLEMSSCNNVPVVSCVHMGRRRRRMRQWLTIVYLYRRQRRRIYNDLYGWQVLHSKLNDWLVPTTSRGLSFAVHSSVRASKRARLTDWPTLWPRINVFFLVPEFWKFAQNYFVRSECQLIVVAQTPQNELYNSSSIKCLLHLLFGWV